MHPIHTTPMNRRTLLGTAAGLALTATATTSPASAQARSTWLPGPSLPINRAEVGVASLNGLVYVVGGTRQTGNNAPQWSSTDVQAYNPRTGTWRTLAPLPTPLSHVGLAATGGHLYAFGGFTDAVHLNPQQAALTYDPHHNRWARLPDLPTPRGSAAVAAVHGRLHVLGGRDSHQTITPPGSPFAMGYGTLRRHDIYDPVHRTWSTGPDLPGEPRDHMGIAVVADRIHLFGGRTRDVGDNLARHDVYNPHTRHWSTAAPLPAPRSSGAATVLDHQILYAGGECTPDAAGHPFTDVTLYQPHHDRWITLTPLTTPRHAFGAATIGHTAYFAAGAPTCGGGASSDLLTLELHR